MKSTHLSEGFQLSFSCLPFHVIFPAKPRKHSKVWKCCFRYCDTKYAEDCGYLINSFCYLQLKSDNLINTKSTTCLSISHTFSSWYFLCNGNGMTVLGAPFSFLHHHTSWLGGCTDLYLSSVSNCHTHAVMHHSNSCAHKTPRQV